MYSMMIIGNNAITYLMLVEEWILNAITKVII